jgi:oxygen-independent coproporphyrinogen-3 oxidase
MGLRLREGVDLGRIANRTGVDDLIDEEAALRLERQGLVSRSGTRLHVTRAGMLVLNAILVEIVRT